MSTAAPRSLCVTGVRGHVRLVGRVRLDEQDVAPRADRGHHLDVERDLRLPVRVCDRVVARLAVLVHLPEAPVCRRAGRDAVVRAIGVQVRLDRRVVVGVDERDGLALRRCRRLPRRGCTPHAGRPGRGPSWDAVALRDDRKVDPQQRLAAERAGRCRTASASRRLRRPPPAEKGKATAMAAIAARRSEREELPHDVHAPRTASLVGPAESIGSSGPWFAPSRT